MYSMYQITEYSKQKADELGVTIQNSTNPKKKIDIYKHGKKVCSIGSLGFGDYPTFLKEKGKSYADQRRRLYKIRHEKDRHKVGSNGWYADNILW